MQMIQFVQDYGIVMTKRYKLSSISVKGKCEKRTEHRWNAWGFTFRPMGFNIDKARLQLVELGLLLAMVVNHEGRTLFVG